MEACVFISDSGSLHTTFKIKNIIPILFLFSFFHNNRNLEYMTGNKGMCPHSVYWCYIKTTARLIINVSQNAQLFLANWPVVPQSKHQHSETQEEMFCPRNSKVIWANIYLQFQYNVTLSQNGHSLLWRVRHIWQLKDTLIETKKFDMISSGNSYVVFTLLMGYMLIFSLQLASYVMIPQVVPLHKGPSPFLFSPLHSSCSFLHSQITSYLINILPSALWYLQSLFFRQPCKPVQEVIFMYFYTFLCLLGRMARKNIQNCTAA
jgi:hypothetical protein